MRCLLSPASTRTPSHAQSCSPHCRSCWRWWCYRCTRSPDLPASPDSASFYEDNQLFTIDNIKQQINFDMFNNIFLRLIALSVMMSLCLPRTASVIGQLAHEPAPTNDLDQLSPTTPVLRKYIGRWQRKGLSVDCDQLHRPGLSGVLRWNYRCIERDHEAWSSNEIKAPTSLWTSSYGWTLIMITISSRNN